MPKNHKKKLSENRPTDQPTNRQSELQSLVNTIKNQENCSYFTNNYLCIFSSPRRNWDVLINKTREVRLKIAALGLRGFWLSLKNMKCQHGFYDKEKLLYPAKMIILDLLSDVSGLFVLFCWMNSTLPPLNPLRIVSAAFVFLEENVVF